MTKELKLKNDTILGMLMQIGSILTDAANVENKSKLSTYTTYWLECNKRYFKKIGEEYDELLKGIQSTELFKEFTADKEGKTNEEVFELTKSDKYKEMLENADDEIRDFVNKESTVKVYPIKLSVFELEAKYVSVFMDLIEE